MNRPLIIDHVSDDLLRHRALQDLCKGALDAWSGGARPVSPHMRRYYSHYRPAYLTENHAPLPPLPSRPDGKAALHAILQGWRGDGPYAALGAMDDGQGSPIRRALVVAGSLLAGSPTATPGSVPTTSSGMPCSPRCCAILLDAIDAGAFFEGRKASPETIRVLKAYDAATMPVVKPA